ncbi:hypothetical protein BDZ89DRAFT_448914 [Hymenopellis radicata]|nr:hypothetical protein BDZ89DRAFT_448914 [Hymenopellis radicata]
MLPRRCELFTAGIMTSPHMSTPRFYGISPASRCWCLRIVFQGLARYLRCRSTPLFATPTLNLLNPPRPLGIPTWSYDHHPSLRLISPLMSIWISRIPDLQTHWDELVTNFASLWIFRPSHWVVACSPLHSVCELLAAWINTSLGNLTPHFGFHLVSHRRILRGAAIDTRHHSHFSAITTASASVSFQIRPGIPTDLYSTTQPSDNCSR